MEHSITNTEDLGYVSQKEEPNTQYEILRRRIGANVQEFWYFVHSEMLKLQKQVNEIAPELVQEIHFILNLGIEHKR